MKTIGKICI